MEIKVPTFNTSFNKPQTLPNFTYNPEVRVCMQNDLLNGSKKAVIIFSSPTRKDIPHARRSQVYNITDKTISAIDEAINSSENLYNSSYLLGNKEANRAILPSFDAQPLYTKPFADMWSFVMFVDNESRLNSSTTFENVRSFNGPKNRFVYSGYCSSEPFSKLLGTYKLNPDCYLIILHCNQTILSGMYSHHGEKVIEQLTKNQDIVNPSATLQMSQNDLLLITPSSLRHGIVSHDPQTNVIGISTNDARVSLKDMVQTDSVPTISRDLNIPKQHFNSLVYNLASAIEVNKTIADDSSYEMKSNTGFRFHGPDIINQAFDSRIKEMQLDDIVLGIDPKQPISLKSLQDIYPMLEVHHFNINSNERDIVNPMERSAQNVFSDLVATSLTPIITEAGFVTFSFQYQSFTKNNFGNFGNFEILAAETALPWSSDITKLKIKSLIRDIEILVFPMIKTNIGEFSLMCSVVNCGEAIVQLNLLDCTNEENGLFVKNNLFGGLASPLVGDRNVYNHNATSLQSLINHYDNIKSPISNSPLPLVDFNYPYGNMEGTSKEEDLANYMDDDVDINLNEFNNLFNI